MDVSIRDVGDILAIDIEGKLDTQTSTQALEILLKCLEPGHGKVLVSLAQLEFVSSAGLRVILRVGKEVHKSGGELKVSGAQGVVREVLEISGFDSLLDLYEDETAAVAAF